MDKSIKIDQSWLIHIESEFKKEYMFEIKKNLIHLKKMVFHLMIILYQKPFLDIAQME